MLTAGRPTEGNKQVQFWGADDDDDHLVVEILEGKKTATCCPRVWWDPERDHDPPGTLLDVHDLRGRCRCTIRIREVYETRYGDVDERTVRGENCRDLAEFKRNHERAWAEDLARAGHTLDDDTPIVVEHFELVEA